MAISLYGRKNWKLKIENFKFEIYIFQFSIRLCRYIYSPNHFQNLFIIPPRLNFRGASSWFSAP